jgi:hypothetical protein
MPFDAKPAAVCAFVAAVHTRASPVRRGCAACSVDLACVSTLCGSYPFTSCWFQHEGIMIAAQFVIRRIICSSLDRPGSWYRTRSGHD